MPFNVHKRLKDVVFLLELSKRGRPIIESDSAKNISLRSGESTTLECLCKNRRERPRIIWLNKRNKLNRLQKLDLDQNDIKTQNLSSLKKHRYEIINSKHYGVASTSERVMRARGKKERSYAFRLRLRNVGEKDSGLYACLVRNKNRSDYRKFFVNVKPMKGKFHSIASGKMTLGIKGHYIILWNLDSVLLYFL